MDLEIVREFSSRRNSVSLAKTKHGELVVCKKYKDLVGMAKELEVLKRFSKCGYAPAVLEAGSDYLINQYIDGEIFFDKFRLATMTDDVVELEKLAGMLSVFLQIFYSMWGGYIIGDINFKNFIINDNRCYGIDYESVREGMEYLDVADIVANALIHSSGDPMAGMPFVSKILQNFHFDIIDIINDVRFALEKKMDKYGYVYDVEILLNILMYYNDHGNNLNLKEGIV